MRWWVLVALTVEACAATPPATTAPPWQRHACDGMIPPAVDAMLVELAAPTREHCEQHTQGGVTALYVRTMNTTAHDDAGDPLPTCQWEVFRLAPLPTAHLRSASACQLAL